MASKKLLMSVRHNKGEVTTMATISIRDSALAPNSSENVIPGNFSLSHAPHAASMMDITPELVAMFKELVVKLENAVKEAEVEAAKAAAEAKAEEKAEEKAKLAKDKEQKTEQK